jgi:hypothetical protein
MVDTTPAPRRLFTRATAAASAALALACEDSATGTARRVEFTEALQPVEGGPAYIVATEIDGYSVRQVSEDVLADLAKVGRDAHARLLLVQAEDLEARALVVTSPIFKTFNAKQAAELRAQAKALRGAA